MADERRRALAGVLAPLAENPSRVGVFCDFDGSLAPIVDDPRSARPVRGVPRVLEKLARRFGLVAVVSGRPVSFLVDRLHARSVRLVGLYGVEERIGRRLEVLPEAQSARASVDRAVARLEQELAGEKGVWVEHKGFSLSVHARRSADPPAAMERIEPIVRAAAEDEGLSALTRGRLVLEAGPRVAVDKGEVVRRLIEDRALTGALVVGDDVGDI
ncbi:MAG: trehalose-phosphatase, partial [Actinomycetota bacterium]